MAAHKKFIVGRVADVCMFAAVGLLYAAFGTLQIDQLLQAATQAAGAAPDGAARHAAGGGARRCSRRAQLPFHGWLIQVMEAPTPVSALLHAGVVNLGGFVLIRLAPLVAELPLAMALLVVAGTATAVIAALVMTTRISIKVMLAWSTCAQMGFMLMQCGLGLWEMALLHLVAHSLYKAHCLSGRRRHRAPEPGAPAGHRRRAAACVDPAARRAGRPVDDRCSGARLAGQRCAWRSDARPLGDGRHPHAGAGAAAATHWPRRLRACWKRPAAPSLLACIYFGLHAWLVTWASPPAQVPGLMGVVLVGLAFAALFVVQSALATRPQGDLAARLYPAFYGGLFLDEKFSRIAFRLWPLRAPEASATAPASLATAHS